MAMELLSSFEIQEKIRAKEAVTIRTYHMDDAVVDYIVSVLEQFLSAIHKENILDEIAYCLRELLDNAQKANIKRAFFLNEGLRIEDADDYTRGMQTFSDRAFSTGPYLETLKAHEWYIEARFSIHDNRFKIDIINHTALLPQERSRILRKLSKAKVYNSLDQVFEDISDETESAGLGLVMLIIMLRKLGMPDRNFNVSGTDHCTCAALSIPLSLMTDEESKLVSDELIAEINTIPQFPESILQLTRMLNDPKNDLREISRLVKHDPALTMEVLRTANSAHYRRYNRIENSDLAISILGTRGLRYILQSYGARRALEEKYNGALLQDLWQHSLEMAEICAMLCRRYNGQDEEADIAYVSALLHDIGKIILEGRNPDAYAALRKICAEKKVSAGAVEDLIAGVNHALLGARMAENWNIPDRIVGTIRYCPVPLSAPDDIRGLCKLIYVAHMVEFKIHGEAKEYEIEENILREFGLDRQENLEQLAADIQAALTA
jgi:putative nucleotidyltransferase with HDIG domain